MTCFYDIFTLAYILLALLENYSPPLAKAVATLKQAKVDELLAKPHYERNKFLYEAWRSGCTKRSGSSGK